MKEERIRILQMVQNQSLSAEEGATLLSAMSETGEDISIQDTIASASQASAETPPWRWFRIRVTDTTSGRLKTSLKMPFSLLDFGLRIGGVAGFDTNDLRAAFVGVGESKILEVEDFDDGEHIEIFLE